MGPRLIALEGRITNAILLSGGGFDADVPPTVDAFRFALYADIPVLMLNGCYDENFPFETSQLPLYEKFPDAATVHFLLNTGHGLGGEETSDRFKRRMLDWLELYHNGRARADVDPGVTCGADAEP